jgi:hypothetical protein
MEQVNAFNDYRKQSNGPYSETYNPRWRNHPNFSWKQNQLGDQGGASHHAYQAPNQAPTSMTQSLEETLRDFMKMTDQSINDVRSSTMVNIQAIAKLEMQMGQLANHLGERDKGKLPSQPMENPKAFTIRNSSSQVHGQEHAHVIVTLRSKR